MIVVGWILFVGLACCLGTFPDVVAQHPMLKWKERQFVQPIHERKGRSRSMLDEDMDMNDVEGI